MKGAPRRSRHRLHIVSAAPASLERPDELVIARARMRHLAPWHVEPLPATHSVTGRPDAQPTSTEREHHNRLATRILAIQIWSAGAGGALQRK